MKQVLYQISSTMSQSNRLSQDYNDMVKKMTQELVVTIQQSIVDQTVDFSDQRASFDTILKKSNQVRSKKYKFHEEVKPSLDQIKCLKESKITEIKELERKENILKKSVISKSLLHSQSSPKLQKSSFTKQQIKQIKKIIKRQKVFEEQLKQKEEKLQKLISQKKLEEEQHKKKVLQEKCQQRKKQLTKQREQLRKQQQQRKQKLQAQIFKIKQLKKRKALYEHMNESWIKVQQAEQLEKKRLWQIQKSKKKLNAHQIIEHYKKYIQQRKQRQLKRERQLQQKRQESRIELPYLYNKIFYQNQKQEEYARRLGQLKHQEITQNVTKKKQFAKLIKEVYFPKIKMNSSINSTIEISKKEGLDHETTYRLGNTYMKEVHQKIPVKKIENEKKNKPIDMDENGGYSVHYKNYLNDLKAFNKENKSVPKGDMLSILRSTKLDQGTKLMKIRQMAHKMDNNKSDRQILQSIKSKLHILKELAN